MCFGFNLITQSVKPFFGKYKANTDENHSKYAGLLC